MGEKYEFVQILSLKITVKMLNVPTIAENVYPKITNHTT